MIPYLKPPWKPKPLTNKLTPTNNTRNRSIRNYKNKQNTANTTNPLPKLSLRPRKLRLTLRRTKRMTIRFLTTHQFLKKMKRRSTKKKHRRKLASKSRR